MEITGNIIDELVASLPEGEVRDVRIGAFWTAVVIEKEGLVRCGLASTMHSGVDHSARVHAVGKAGELLASGSRELAGLARSSSTMEATVGLATINALLPQNRGQWTSINAEQVIADLGTDKQVVIVGHFPFVSQLRQKVAKLWVLELNPRDDDLPADEAANVIPQADVIAITGTTLINHTFDGLIALCRPGATVLVLGPSTPLSPVLFDHGVDILCGAIVEDIELTLYGVSQGADFHQLYRHGVRLVSMQKCQKNTTLRRETV